MYISAERHYFYHTDEIIISHYTINHNEFEGLDVMIDFIMRNRIVHDTDPVALMRAHQIYYSTGLNVYRQRHSKPRLVNLITCRGNVLSLFDFC